MLNIELLRDAVEWAEWQDTLDIEKREWDQQAWFVDFDQVRKGTPPGFLTLFSHYQGKAEERSACGTAYCLAGYVAQKMEGESYLRFMFQNDPYAAKVPVLAAKHLGVPEEDLIDLFEEGNRVADIRRCAENLAAKHGMVL